MRKITIILAQVFLCLGVYSQTTIAVARTQAIGSQVAVSGIVTNGSELGTIRYLQDATGGIAAYASSLAGWHRGDSVSVVGFTTDYNGLMEISNIVGSTVYSSGNDLPEPQLVTPLTLGEDYESELIRINQVVFDDGGGTFASNTSYYFTSDGESASIYVRSNHPLIGKVIPSVPVDIIGICSQFYSTYQVLLRDTNDIINDNSINIITKISQTNISTSGFQLEWQTDVPGSTEIRYGYTPNLELGILQFPGTSLQHQATLSGQAASEILYIQAFSVNGTDTAAAPVGAFATVSNSSGDIKVYFTNTVDNSVSITSDAYQADDAIDDTLIAYINRAKYQLDIAVYDSNPEGVSDIAAALDAAYNRGVEIRLIVDTSWSAITLASLITEPIPFVIAPTEEPYAIMHNKFMVMDPFSSNPDEPILWTGSTNFEGTNINDFSNSVIIIQDQSMAKAYRLEFNEMWGSSDNVPNPATSRFGPFKKNNTPHEFLVDGIRIESYFSPSDGATTKILECIQSAEDELYIATMLITRSDLAYAIRDQHDAGVTTQVLVNDKASCTSLVVSTLEASLGNDFAESSENGIMHHKYLVADQSNATSDPLVLLGSHNWSNAAENTNDENTLIVHNQEIANWYYQEFHARYLINFLNSQVFESPVSWKVYPNPVSDQLYLESSSNSNGIIKITDIQGKTVIEISLEEAVRNGISIRNANLKPGYYIIRLEDKQASFIGKLLVN